MDERLSYRSRCGFIMIDKAVANQSSLSDLGGRWKDTALHPFKFASGEGATSAVKTRAKGCLRLGAPISFTRLAGVPIKSASGASGNRRKRRTPKSISDAESAFEVGGS